MWFEIARDVFAVFGGLGVLLVLLIVGTDLRNQHKRKKKKGETP